VRNVLEKVEREGRNSRTPSEGWNTHHFLVDGMLGSTARKLRIYGYDTVYLKDADDEELIRVSTMERRLLLTSDRRLAQDSTRRGVGCILVTGRDDKERLCCIFRTLRLSPRLDPSISRCASCNGGLREVDKNEVSLSVPALALARHDRFYVCDLCGKTYWEGSHWSKLEAFNSDLQNCLLDRR
jgi:uncharacterized protein with PIN domain